MKSIRLLLLLASGVTTGAFAQSGGLTDMSQSRFAKMANTELGAVHWTDGFWGDRFNVYSHTSLQSMWDTWNNPDHVGKHIISTALEHSSVGGALSALQQQGCEVDLVDIRRDGTIDLEHLRELLRKDTVLVAVCAVDSELGTVQPIQEIADILRDYPNCRLHVDATQAVGKTKLVLSGVDTMSIAPHKFYGLNGSGLLVKKKDLVIEPQIHGGGSTTPYRSGTPALGMAMSIEKALRLALENQNERIAHVAALNRLLRAELAKYPKVRFNSPENAVPHILNLSVNGVKGTAFQQKLGKNDVCVSVKSACSVEGTPSRAVYAVSRDRKNALSSWRISLSHLTTEAEIAEFLQIFDRCYRELAQ